MNLIQKYFDLTPTQKEQFDQLAPLYKEWNAKINVISRKDIEHLEVNHVLHSLAIAKVISFSAGTKVLDVGTGGGFPGIPLAIMFPEAHFTLLDSIGKKLKVVENVAASIGLKNIEVTHSRVEDLDTKYDFIISRAVTALPRFFGWVSDKVDKEGKNELNNGIFYLKGGDFSEELEKIPNALEVFDLSSFFGEDFFETKKLVYIKS